MKLDIKYIILILFFCPTINIYSQRYTIKQYSSDLNIKFEVIDEKRFDKAFKYLEDADEEKNEASVILAEADSAEIRYHDGPNYNKALKNLVDASELYKEGHELIFQIFKEKCVNFYEVQKKANHHAAGMQKAKYYERMAVKNMNMALLLREGIVEGDRIDWVEYKMEEALELEKLAIRDQGRALQIYQDFPVEYNYGWEDDVTPEEVAEAFKNPVVNKPPEELYDNPFAFIDTTYKGKEINLMFKVQIAAHTIPLTEDYLRTIYKGGMDIDLIIEDNWYKYSIGRFDNFEDANALLQKCNVKRAFVAAYNNGKKITITEAKRLYELKNQ
jgi:hypothetical protein